MHPTKFKALMILTESQSKISLKIVAELQIPSHIVA